VAWWQVVKNFILSEEVFEPLILIVLGSGLRALNRQRRSKVLDSLTEDIVDYIEENYRRWGIRGQQKMDKFIELLINEFRKEMGYKPSKKELETAKLKAEAKVQRVRRESIVMQFHSTAKRPFIATSLSSSH